MDSSRPFPPSPALSECDSLAGIDDLDAFLDAKGALSRWPTPSPKLEHVEDLEPPSEESDNDSEDFVDDVDIATVFACELGSDGVVIWDTIMEIEDVLRNSQLPIETMALAFNIFCKLVGQGTIDLKVLRRSAGLFVISTLSLASIYTSDHPLASSYWAETVAGGHVTAKQVDNINFDVMEALDWRVHECSESSKIDAAIRRFSQDGVPAWRDAPAWYAPEPAREYPEGLEPPPPSAETPESPVTRKTGNVKTRWSNGQVTPGCSSTCSVI